MKRFAIALCLVTINAAAWAQLPLPIGTWIKQPSSTPPMMMVIEPAGPGIKITYRMLGPDGKAMNQSVLTIVTALDGKEVPMMIDGKDWGRRWRRCTRMPITPRRSSRCRERILRGPRRSSRRTAKR